MDEKQLLEQITQIGEKALLASRKLATLTEEKKNQALECLADFLVQKTDLILEANQKDLLAGEEKGLSKAMLDRLRFTPERIEQMAEGVRQVIALPDPVGTVLESSERPNGLLLQKVSVPIGVVGIIYESRPNVTIDCAVLCLKSGNASILRGGSEAFYSNSVLAEVIADALSASGLDPATVQLIPTTDRAATSILLKMDKYMNCIIPRGGEGLIRFVAENALMPVIKHYKGVCHLYVDKDANAEMALDIAVNAKTQRPGVCNAIENLFVHEGLAETQLPSIAKALIEKDVELRCDAKVKAILDSKAIACSLANEDDFEEEYVDLILSIGMVSSLEEAIDRVNKYGSGHSDCIVTDNEIAAESFMNAIDTSTVYWNASTRFTDGFEFGLGAEIGISTDKLHARGPMGLKELTTYKYKVFGKGQIRK